MTLEDKVHAFRLHLFWRAQALGNMSAACRELGVSRSLYYQLRQRSREKPFEIRRSPSSPLRIAITDFYLC